VATNFPTSLDSLTNPTSTDQLTSPSHADQHANANDAIEALQAKVGVNSSAVTTSLDYKVEKILAVSQSNRNVIINGAFDVWQRGTSFTTDAAATVIYTADRWGARALYPGFGAVQTITRETTNVPTGFVYSLKSVVATAAPQNGARMQVFYTMENIDTMKYAGKTMTVSCQVKSIGNINRLYIAPSYNTSGGKSVDGTTIVTQSFTVNTSSFTTCSFSFTVPSASTLTSTATLGLVFSYDRTSGIEQVGDGIYLGAVQLEAGSVATPFELEDYGTTLAKCERYFQKNASLIEVTYGGTVNSYIFWQFRTPMRATPTVTNTGATTASATTLDMYYAYRSGGNTVQLAAGATAAIEL